MKCEITPRKRTVRVFMGGLPIGEAVSVTAGLDEIRRGGGLEKQSRSLARKV